MCQLRKQARGGLILGYGGTNTTEIQDGVRRLKAILDKLQSNRAGEKTSVWLLKRKDSRA
jgi:hypothetical protein